jgi:glycosyltransferase involved in cell wall biosynthesis
VTWLRARPSQARGRAPFEPDRRELQRLMRAAVERGPAAGRAQDSIAASTRRFTWMRTVEIVDTALERMVTRGSRVRRVPPSPSDRLRPGPSVVFFDGRPAPDRSRTAARIDALLARRHPHHRSIPFDAPRLPGRVPLVVGQAGSCLEGFLTAASGARRLLLCNRAPLEAQLAATNRERHALGLAAAPVSPLDLWRHREEARLADRIVVSTRLSRAQLRQAGHPAAQLRVVPPGVDRAAIHRRPSNAAVRFLFVSSDPFRSGIRVLLEAFGRVEGPRLELWCITTREILDAPVVLRHLAADSRVSVRRLLGHRGFLRLYEQVDVVVLPSFAEGFGRVVADGMMRGKPGIVSDRTGVSEAITDGASGVIVPAGDVGSLTEAIDGLARDRRAIRTLGDAAHEAVRALTWSLFGARFNAVLDEWDQP